MRLRLTVYKVISTSQSRSNSSTIPCITKNFQTAIRMLKFPDILQNFCPGKLFFLMVLTGFAVATGGTYHPIHRAKIGNGIEYIRNP